jgi:hypothetical protein
VSTAINTCKLYLLSVRKECIHRGLRGRDRERERERESGQVSTEYKLIDSFYYCHKDKISSGYEECLLITRNGVNCGDEALSYVIAAAVPIALHVPLQQDYWSNKQP